MSGLAPGTRSTLHPSPQSKLHGRTKRCRLWDRNTPGVGLPAWRVSVLLATLYLTTQLTTCMADLLHHHRYTMDIMSGVNDTYIVPHRLVPPLDPGAAASHHLACRATRGRFKPPPYNSTYSDPYFDVLSRLPPNLSTCSPLDWTTPLDGRWYLSDTGPEYVLEQRIVGALGLPPTIGVLPVNAFQTNGTNSMNGSSVPLPACRLRRFSADHALTCLRGRHLAFMGDSTVRYQFLALLYWLSNDGFQDATDTYPTIEGHLPSVVNIGHWGGHKHWAEFYPNMTALFNDSGCISTACTQCSHMQGYEHWRVNFTLGSGDQVSVTMNTNLAHGLDRATQHLRLLLNTSSPDRPDVLLLNHGIWFIMGSGGAHFKHSATDFVHYYEAMFQLAREYVSAQPAPQTRLVFRATTSYYPQPDIVEGMSHRRETYRDWEHAWPYIEGMVKSLCEVYAIEYYDIDKPSRNGLVQGLDRMDNCHYNTYANNVFNDLLLNILC